MRKQALCGILVATQLTGVWSAVAQPDTPRAARPRLPAPAINRSLAAAVWAYRTNPAVVVSPRSLEFAPVAVGGTGKLVFTVRNTGGSTLAGVARASAPFSVAGGGSYILRSSQSQAITVEYAPKAAGMNVGVVHLTGGGGASVTVAGSAFWAAPASRPPPAAPAPPSAPVPPQNRSLLAGW